jgi:5-methylcytosine-specific restriction endonuclease McrA
MKQCSKCKLSKPTSEFYKRPSRKCGLSSYCKACETARCLNWYNSNKEKVSQASSIRHLKNKDIANAKSREYHQANKLAINNRHKNHKLKNAEKYKESERKWRQLNPEKVRQQSQLRRARIKNNGTYKILNKDLLRLYSSPCLYCASTVNIEADHVIPISRGGTHGIGNLVPACRSCNARKSNRTIMEWRKLES